MFCFPCVGGVRRRASGTTRNTFGRLCLELFVQVLQWRQEHLLLDSVNALWHTAGFVLGLSIRMHCFLLHLGGKMHFQCTEFVFGLLFQTTAKAYVHSVCCFVWLMIDR
jgi:hypothetical protein